MGGVVPVVVFGVVPGVVLGVVPVVVLGVVPVVVLGVVGVVVVGIAAGALGGQSVLLLDGVLAEGFGMLALGLVAEGLDVLIPGELDALDAVEGVVVVTGQAVAGVDCTAGEAGVVLSPLLALEDCEPGTTGVGVIAPVGGEVVWAVAIPTAKQRTAAIRIAREVIHISPVWFTGGMRRAKAMDALADVKEDLSHEPLASKTRGEAI